MKLSPLQTIVFIVILAGIAYGAYSATIDQLPDVSGTVVGNTTVNNSTNPTIGTVYLYDDTNNSSNTSVNMSSIKNGCKIDVYTVGDPTNTIPPQVISERIVIKAKK